MEISNLGQDDWQSQEDGEDPDHHHHLPAVAQGADRPGVDGEDYHYKPGIEDKLRFIKNPHTHFVPLDIWDF